MGSNRHITFISALAAAAALASPCVAQSFTFAPAVSRACTPSHLPTRVVATDVDQNGMLDLLLPGRDSNALVNWVPLDSAGVPGTMQQFASPGQTDAAVIGDFNGDGQPDVAFSVRAYSGRLAVYLRGEEGLAAVPIMTQLDREPRALVAGDWNGDGATDLATTQYGNQAILILMNNGLGEFSIAQRIAVEPWSGGTAGPQELLVGDMNGDGHADLVGTMLGTRRIDLMFGSAAGTFGSPVAWMAPDLADDSRPGVTTAALGDLDGDGDLDVAVTLIASSGPQPLLVFVNNGAGEFPQNRMFMGAEVGLGWGTALGDLDADGDLDVVTGTALPGGVLVWENITLPEGEIEFAPPQSLGSGTFVRDICIGHLDSDCDLDIAYAEIAGNSVRVYRQLRDCGGNGLAHGSGTRSGGATLATNALDPQQLAAAALGNALKARGNTSEQLALLLASFGAPPDRAASTQFFDAPASCGPAGPGGRCDEPHLTPGCFTTPCCETVCGFDPQCCDVAWDQLCVDIAESECAGMVCPQYGSCSEVHSDPGCQDPECCERITRLDGYCQELWDHICVQRVADVCGVPPCTVQVPPDASDEGEICYQKLNDGPNYPGDLVADIANGQAVSGTCSTRSPRDTDWYRLPGSGKRRVRLEVNAEFPCEVHLVHGPFAGPLMGTHLVHGGECTPVTLEACIDGAGPWHAVVTMGSPAGAIRQGQPCTVEDPENPWDPKDPPPTPGYDGEMYLIRCTLSLCAQSPDLNGDGTVDGADLGVLLGHWGLSGGVSGDLNGDGTVDGADLGTLLGAWGPVS